MENTLIVYCSDHGEMLGDHGLGGKSQPYHPSACVPLVIAGPGVRDHVVCNDPVETLDLTATFLDFAGVPRPGEMESRSLRPFLEAKAALPRNVARSSLKGWSLVFDGRYKLIAGSWNWGKKDKSATKQVLYDLAEDPAETVDISSDHPEIVQRLRPLLPPVNPYKTARAKRRRK